MTSAGGEDCGGGGDRLIETIALGVLVVFARFQISYQISRKLAFEIQSSGRLWATVMWAKQTLNWGRHEV